MIAYELLAHLRHLTLAGQDEDGDLEWICTREKWQAVAKEIKQYEKPTQEDGN
jgi:hypothetical protein